MMKKQTDDNDDATDVEGVGATGDAENYDNAKNDGC